MLQRILGVMTQPVRAYAVLHFVNEVGPKSRHLIELKLRESWAMLERFRIRNLLQNINPIDRYFRKETRGRSRARESRHRHQIPEVILCLRSNPDRCQRLDILTVGLIRRYILPKSR
jgi:hypothetical protein